MPHRGSLWSFDYFFYDSGQRRIVIFSCVVRFLFGCIFCFDVFFRIYCSCWQSPKGSRSVGVNGQRADFFAEVVGKPICISHNFGGCNRAEGTCRNWHGCPVCKKEGCNLMGSSPLNIRSINSGTKLFRGRRVHEPLFSRVLCELWSGCFWNRMKSRDKMTPFKSFQVQT